MTALTFASGVATRHDTSVLPYVAALLIVTGGYWLASQIWPYANCGRCHGSGHGLRSPSGKTWRNCSRCGGSGKRERLLYRGRR